jgi:serine/threonine protein kinase
MEEVCRARDPQLGRDVALKILPEECARGPERLARFEREARTLALLNHPHILHHRDRPRSVAHHRPDGVVASMKMA